MLPPDSFLHKKSFFCSCNYCTNSNKWDDDHASKNKKGRASEKFAIFFCLIHPCFLWTPTISRVDNVLHMRRVYSQRCLLFAKLLLTRFRFFSWKSFQSFLKDGRVGGFGCEISSGVKTSFTDRRTSEKNCLKRISV